LNAIKRFITTVPLWAFLLVLLAIVVNTLYFYYRGHQGADGQSNTNRVINYVTPGGPADKAGIIPGDSLVTVDSMDVSEWSSLFRGDQAGDTAVYGVIRDGQKLDLPLVFSSGISYFYGFALTVYILLIFVSIASLYLLYKKPQELAAKILFIFILAFTITQNATYLVFREPLAIAATFLFMISGCMFGPLLIHFYLLFPRTAKIFFRLKWLPVIFYLAGLIFCIVYFYHYLLVVEGKLYYYIFSQINRIVLMWLTATYFLAVAVVIYQFITIKDTLSRNQLRLIIIGSFFGIYTAVLIVFFPDVTYNLSAGRPYFFTIAQGTGGLVMIIFILVAIFRYRIWDISIIIRKALQYFAATILIILTYLLLIYLVSQLIDTESDLIRFLALAVSVVIFLVLRDRLQRLIDRLFHRESYDSATVVAEFEEKLSGGYRIEDLGYRILDCIDDIFHFRSFVFCLKEVDLNYYYAFSIGTLQENPTGKFVINYEFERKLKKAKVFSPQELDVKNGHPGWAHGELIVPMVKDNEPFGFFLCGPKKSEKSYSMQDIRVLSLIAKRVIALFQTAALYQKDLDRQLMLERERARISQDMHDDVGASLTRISILSELAKNKPDITDETRQWLSQISDTSRSVMEEMSQIVWALNPKNDTLEGLVAYLRRFANEYLEPTTVKCMFDLPEKLQKKALSVEIRRNVYLVVREALHNVVKHSGATRAGLTLKVEDSKFKISIRDDGKGFDPDKLEFPGNGLINMKKRMNDIGGEIFIRSEPGLGTEIELIVSL
jgi:signal transduction histidine kinase